MILDNAQVLTMDEAMPRASALVIAGGRILGGVDSREDVIASHAHERIDLQGACVLPGFVDAHVHFRAWALSRVRIDLRGCTSADELVDAVRVHVQQLDKGAWVLGGGWPEHALAAGGGAGMAGLTTRIEEAAAGRPAALVSKDGHAIWVNARALEQLGCAEDDLEVPGGVVERRADGRFAGVLREEAAWRVRRTLPDDDLTTAVLATAMREAARRGVTSLHDMDGATGLRSWRTLERERGLALRVWQQVLADELEHAAALGVDAGFGSDRLRLGGIKAFADGTLGSGTAWLAEPELAPAGSAPRAGVTLLDRAELQSLAIRAAQAGFPIFVHAIGDAAAHAVVDALEATQEHWQHLAVRPRIEHAQLMNGADIERCAQLGIALSVQPTHLVTDRDIADERWGSERTARAFAFRTMLEAGAGLLLGSDAPIEDLHPLAAIHAATTRDGGAHGLARARGAWHPEQVIDMDTALRASTSWPADAVGASGRLGRLTPGHDADLVVLDGNPLERPAAELNVVATMVGGRWTFGAANLR